MAQKRMDLARKHVELANKLRKEILIGKYGEKGRLPDVSTIMEEEDASRLVVEKALAFLEGEQLIIQKGVSFAVNRMRYPMIGYVPPVAERLQDIGRVGYIKNIGEVKRVLLPEHLSSVAKLDVRIPVVLQSCVVGEVINGNEYPTQFAHYYWILPLSDEDMQHMQDDSKFDPVAERFAVFLSREDEITSRASLTQYESDALKVPVATSVLGCLSVIRDVATNNVILVQEDIFVASRIAFTYHYQFDNRPKKEE